MDILKRRESWPEREKIFMAARVLMEKGMFVDASLGEIAYHAKVSETTLRVFFRSKQEIVSALSTDGGKK